MQAAQGQDDEPDTQDEPTAPIADPDDVGVKGPDDVAPAQEWPTDAPPRNLFGKARQGTRLKANGQTWIIGTDNLPKRVQ